MQAEELHTPSITEGKEWVVSLLVENELVRCGLAALLARIPRMSLVNSLKETSEASKQTKILIAEADLWCNADPGVHESATRGGPWIILVGDEQDRRNLERHPAAQFNDFLKLIDIDATALEDALRRATRSAASGQPRSPLRRVHIWQRTIAPMPGPAALTPRENETLSLLTDGLSNKQIARALGISPHGAKRLVGTIMTKLGAPNRTAAAVIALNFGLVPHRLAG